MTRSEVFITVDYIEFNEGFRDRVYKDSEGIETIGIGRNLRTYPFSEYEKEKYTNSNGEIVYHREDARQWVAERVNEIYDDIVGESWFVDVFPRKTIVIDVIFNIGLRGWNGFKKTKAHLADYNFGLASLELADSKWYKQVKSRGVRNCEVLKTGIMPKEFNNWRQSND